MCVKIDPQTGLFLQDAFNQKKSYESNSNN